MSTESTAIAPAALTFSPFQLPEEGMMYSSIDQRTYRVSLSKWGNAISEATPWFSKDVVKVIDSYLDPGHDYRIAMQLLAAGKAADAFYFFHWNSYSNNHRDSQDQCAKMLLAGTGVSFNHQEAIRFLRMAAAHQGASDSWFSLAVQLESVGQNAEAIEWYAKAANAGHTVGQYNLGKIFLEGRRGVPVNKDKALVLFNKASGPSPSEEFPDAKNRSALQAAFIYTQSGNYDAARNLLMEAMDLPEARVILASRYCTGIGTPEISPVKARGWLGEAPHSPALIDEDSTAVKVAEFLLTLPEKEMSRSLSFLKPRCDFQNPILVDGSHDRVVQCTQAIYGNAIPTSTRTVHLQVFDINDLAQVSVTCGFLGVEGYALNVEFLDPTGRRIRLPVALIKLPPSPDRR